MADDTAVLDAPDTAADELTPPQDVPETEADGLAPETAGAEGTPETEQPDPLAGLSDEDIANHPKFREMVQGHEARWRESERRKAEAYAQQVAYQQRQQRAYQLANGEAHARIAGIAKAVEEGREFNPQWAASLADDLAGAAFHEQADLIREKALGFIGRVNPQWRVPADVQEYVTRAWHSGDPDAMVDSLFTLMSRAMAESMAPRMAATIEADLKKKSAAASQTERMRQAQANRPDGPTPGLGTAGAGSRSPRDILDSSGPGDPQWAAAFKAQYGIDPP